MPASTSSSHKVQARNGPRLSEADELRENRGARAHADAGDARDGRALQGRVAQAKRDRRAGRGCAGRRPQAAERNRPAPSPPKRDPPREGAAGRPSGRSAGWSWIREEIGDCQALSPAGRPQEHRLRRRQPARRTWCSWARRRGADEDEQGEPFVGKGRVKLLTKMIRGDGLRPRRTSISATSSSARPRQPQSPSRIEVASCEPS